MNVRDFIKRSYEVCALEIGFRHPHYFDDTVHAVDRLKNFESLPAMIFGQLLEVILSTLPTEAISSTKTKKQKSRTPSPKDNNNHRTRAQHKPKLRSERTIGEVMPSANLAKKVVNPRRPPSRILISPTESPSDNVISRELRPSINDTPVPMLKPQENNNKRSFRAEGTLRIPETKPLPEIKPLPEPTTERTVTTEPSKKDERESKKPSITAKEVSKALPEEPPRTSLRSSVRVDPERPSKILPATEIKPTIDPITKSEHPTLGRDSKKTIEVQTEDGLVLFKGHTAAESSNPQPINPRLSVKTRSATLNDVISTVESPARNSKKPSVRPSHSKPITGSKVDSVPVSTKDPVDATNRSSKLSTKSTDRDDSRVSTLESSIKQSLEDAKEFEEEGEEDETEDDIDSELGSLLGEEEDDSD